ncbi:MAG: hypothetical protein FGF52_06195 [Candidatus Brockarchaeota archaeon]|nr:hypothetical protein [Candidatus Brockarchaeota archaeon]
MSQRVCPYVTKCPVATFPICQNPPREYFDLKTKEPAGECLLGHLLVASEFWDRAAKRNLHALLRLCRNYIDGDMTKYKDNIRTLVKSAVILHDTGKLCEEYQQFQKGRFHHEFLSACISFEFAKNSKNPLFQGELSRFIPIVAGSILLHHESRLMRTLLWSGDLELRWEHIVEHLPQDQEMNIKKEYAEAFGIFLRNMLNCNYDWRPREKYTGNDVIEASYAILGFINYHPHFKPYYMRALVGGFLDIISICDSLSAQRSRSGTDDSHRLQEWRELLSKWGRGFNE